MTASRLALAAALLGLGSPCGAAALSEAAKDWPLDARKASDWRDIFFRSERGADETLWMRADAGSLIAEEARDRDFPLFRLADRDEPCPDQPFVSGVKYKDAVLTAYVLHVGKKLETRVSVDGTSLAIERRMRMVNMDGTATPPFPSGKWVVCAPTKTEAWSASPMVNLGAWPECTSWDLDKAWYSPHSKPMLERLHPLEMDLAMIDDGLRFGSSSEWYAALKGSAELDAYVADLRKTLYARAQREKGASGKPDDRFTFLEARLLACRVSRVSSELHEGRGAEEHFYAQLRSAKSPEAFVKAWRPFVGSELALYLEQAKDLPGAGGAASSYASHDYEKLKDEAYDRTLAAVVAGPAKAPEKKPGKAAGKRRAQKSADDAGAWAEELVR